MSDSHEITFLVEVGRRLREARDAHALNLHELARLSGISASALSLIETGKRDPRLTTLNKIAVALRLPLRNLLEDLTASPRSESAADRAAENEGYDLENYR